jgi:para-aminobenzoate synthetase/4-amino-4-deoxychorismate lyase
MATQNTPAMTTLPTPSKAHGLFETLLVVAGEPVELDAHLDRLAASLEALFGAALPAALAAAVGGRARGLRLGRMRITVDPDSRVTLAAADVDPGDFFPAWERGADLQSVRCDGGLGHHKWADRRPLGGVGEGTVPLLLDRGCEILEAGRANVFAVLDGTLVTPAADGRILPGIGRAGAIAAARDADIEVTERPLMREELAVADEVFLTGSVRGVEPARSLDGAALPMAGALSRRIGESLRQRWLPGLLAAAAPAPAAVPPPDRLAR